MIWNKLKTTYKKAKQLALEDSAKLTMGFVRYGKYVTTMFNIWLYLTLLMFYMCEVLRVNLK